MTAQACWCNSRDSIEVIPVCLAMWAFPAVLLQIQLPRSHLQGDLRSETALDGCICGWFLPPFCQDGLNHFQDTKLKVVTLSVQVLQSSYSSVRREETKLCSFYLSYSPDTWPFFARTFSLYALLSTSYCWVPLIVTECLFVYKYAITSLLLVHHTPSLEIICSMSNAVVWKGSRLQ